MSERKRKFYVAAFAFHFLLILSVCCRETFWLISRGLTQLPPAVSTAAQRAEWLAGSITAQETARDNPFRRVLHGYLHLAGIEAGYGFFAPNVPDSYKLVFELTYPDGHLEYVTVDDASSGMGLRFATLMDYIGRTSIGSLRQLLVGFVTSAVWQQHRDVVNIRAFVSALHISTPAKFDSRSEATYELLDSYEFRIRP